MDTTTDNCPPKTTAETRGELQKWFNESKPTDLKFWISPNSITSLEECEAEFLAATKEIGQREKEGKLRKVTAESVKL